MKQPYNKFSNIEYEQVPKENSGTCKKRFNQNACLYA